ncbi:hypothetical protein ACP4OV_001537 [Aristida adscensionis]
MGAMQCWGVVLAASSGACNGCSSASLTPAPVATGGGGHAAVVEKAKVPRYSSAAEGMTYWKTMLPSSPIPVAILDHMKAPAAQGGEKFPFFSYGPHSRGVNKETKLIVNQGGKEIPFFIYGPHSKGFNKETNLFVKQGGEEISFFIYGPHRKGVDKETNPFVKEGGEEIPFFIYGPHSKGAASRRWPQPRQFTNLLFSEDILTPGTMVSPCIPPATTSAPFLHCEDADAIPVSTKNFPDILVMFAPVSLAIASDIQSTQVAHQPVGGRAAGVRHISRINDRVHRLGDGGNAGPPGAVLLPRRARAGRRGGDAAVHHAGGSEGHDQLIVGGGGQHDLPWPGVLVRALLLPLTQADEGVRGDAAG